MFDFPALDVAIGLIFLYIILALVCSTVSEAVSAFVNLRARFLQQGIMNLLSGAKWPTDDGRAMTRSIYEHPLVQSLIRPGHGPEPEGAPPREPRRMTRAWRRVRPLPSKDPTEVTRWLGRPAPYPSYLPSRTFVAALTDLAEREKARLDGLADEEMTEEEKARVRRIARIPDELERTLASIPNEPLSRALLSIYNSVERRSEQFQHAAEQWYDDTMERVSGWYKRKIAVILAVIATLLVVLMNADTLAAARTLWRDDAMRAAVVKKAEALAAPQAAAEEGGTAEPTPAADGAPVVEDLDEAISQLDVPLGWQLSFGDEPTELPNDPVSWLAKLLGFALTIGAVVLGAPFWFDLLSKIMRVRSTGAPPPTTDAVRSGEGDQPRAGRGARTS